MPQMDLQKEFHGRTGNNAEHILQLRGGADPEEVKKVLQGNKYVISVPFIWSSGVRIAL
jgi:hypothetical protein